MTPKAPAQSARPPVRSPEPPAAGAAQRVSRSLYNLLWYPALPLALAIAAGSRRDRLGALDSPHTSHDALRIWLHASSVGEIEAVRPIVSGLLEDYPGASFIVTTMTPAGREAALRRIPAAAACRLAPLDHPLTVRRFLAAAAPGLVLITEAELWPNYFIEARRRGARLALINGRLSDRSLKRYRLMRPLWRAALGCADLLLVQTKLDAGRYRELGAPPERIVVAGNTKFTSCSADSVPHPGLQRFAAQAQTLIAGSTSAGEEQEIIDAWVRLSAEFPALRLVLAPRHLERLPEVFAVLGEKRLPYTRASELKAGGPLSADATILVLDTMGDLRALYRCGTLAFVGGSLFAGRGGQNLGEPAAAGVAVLFGPYHQNQQEMAQALLKRGGGAIVRNSKELAAAAPRLLRDPAAREQMGARAREAYDSLAGGAERTLAHLRALCARS
jgi:3-deoxy-D-manno-octulosonic-acid transferase